MEKWRKIIETYGQHNDRAVSAMIGFGLIQLFKPRLTCQRTARQRADKDFAIHAGNDETTVFFN
jgi:hypothetical protein